MASDGQGRAVEMFLLFTCVTVGLGMIYKVVLILVDVGLPTKQLRPARGRFGVEAGMTMACPSNPACALYLAWRMEIMGEWSRGSCVLWRWRVRFAQHGVLEAAQSVVCEAQSLRRVFATTMS